MKVGIVTVMSPRKLHRKISKSQQGGGILDIAYELESRGHSYRFITPQNIYFDRRQYMIRHKTEENDVTTQHFDTLSEFVEGVDILYMRSVLGSKKPWLRYEWNARQSLKALSSTGLRIVNSPTTIYRTKDKAWVIQNVISDYIPRTAIVPRGGAKANTKSTMEQIVRRGLRGRKPQLVKPIDGHGGRGIIPMPIGSPFRTYLGNTAGNAMLQEHLMGDDIRLYYVGQEFCGAIRTTKTEDDMRANMSTDADNETELSEFQPSEEQISEFRKIHNAVEADFSTTDAILLADGCLKFLEINCFPGWKKYKKVFGVENGLAPKVVNCLENKLESYAR